MFEQCISLYSGEPKKQKIIIEAQRQCEEMYLSSPEPEIKLLVCLDEAVPEEK